MSFTDLPESFSDVNFPSSKGMSKDLTEPTLRTIFKPLSRVYKSFTCVKGPNDINETLPTLQITDGEKRCNLRVGQLLDCFASLNVFGWWDREGLSLLLYFRNPNELKRAKEWIEAKNLGHIMLDSNSCTISDRRSETERARDLY
ncbi:7128_t:CDS:2 [Ambispora leptoticha]|uniref:7128_t:CDS:1 n=1 Tax=Ambispora leptoticha TaxID=144679 RepID=A0A9N9C287_9GLOM|nr:7128_t:CDS:2 [Ambispora leptoticha]